MIPVPLSLRVLTTLLTLTVMTDHSVLLLEARDRIGGRTYTAKKNGKPFQAVICG